MRYSKDNAYRTNLRIAYVLSCMTRKQFVHLLGSRRREVLCAVQKQGLERQLCSPEQPSSVEISAPPN